MPGRQFNSDGYRFGFNGQEKDDEVSGTGNINTAMFWEYDSRLGRRWNVDPVVNPNESDYACFNNNPITITDYLGDDEENECNAYYEGKEDDCGNVYSCSTVRPDGTLRDDAGWVKRSEYFGPGSKLDIRDKYDVKIVKGEYVFARNYMWIDVNHAFKYSDKTNYYGTKQLWSQLSSESGEKRVINGVEGFKVTYGQESGPYGVVSAVESFWVPTGIDKTLKEQIAVAIVNYISYKHEDAQGALLPSLFTSSSFEPSDMPSNVLGLYVWMRGYTKNQIFKMVGAYDIHVSLEVHHMFPGTFTSTMYKNKKPIPRPFITPLYSPTAPVVPAELNVTPATLGLDFKLW